MSHPDDVGPKVSEQSGAERTAQVGVVEHTDASKWSGIGHEQIIAWLR